jgi:Sec-independent protein translocase protein TatA
MFDVSISELSVVAIAAVILVKPEEWPTIASHIKTFINKITDFKKHANNIYQDVVKLENSHTTSTRYILDDDGNPHEVYDLSDLKSLSTLKKDILH